MLYMYNVRKCVTRSVCRLAYKVWGDADYVQPGFLSYPERARVDGTQPGALLAEVAATSTEHRQAAAKRVGGGYLGVYKQNKRNKWRMQFQSKGIPTVTKVYDSPEEAARACDALAWEYHGRYGAATCCVYAAWMVHVHHLP